MPGCAVFGCNNYNRVTKGTNIKYFRFPKSKELSKQWISACRRKDNINLKNATICSIHFHKDCFEDLSVKEQYGTFSTKNARILKTDAVHTLNLLFKRKQTEESERTICFAKRIKSTLLPEQRLENYEGSVSTSLQLNTEEIEQPEQTNVDCTGSTSVQSNAQHKTEKERIAELRIAELEEKVAHLESLNRELCDENLQLKKDMETCRKSLEKCLSSGQIERLLNPHKNLRKWSAEDIVSAISLRSVSPKAYRYLRANALPLPALSTLRKWASSFNLSPGPLTNVINLMQEMSFQLKDIEKLCVLSFDEIHLSNRIDINKKDEQVIGPHKTCQTVMALGLISNWKQPVFYDFDQPMKKEILNQIISALFNAGFTVVAIVSDMGPTNMKFFTEMNIAHDKDCSFPHPCNESMRIFLFVDVPHLINLLRNHFIDQGFWLNGTFMDKSCFERLLDISTSELSIVHKVSKYHIELKGTERQKVRPAVQLFSNSVSKAVSYCGKSGLMPSELPWEQVSDFVQLINRWFDVMNSKTKIRANEPSKNAFGINLEDQKKVLEKTSNVIKTLRVGKHKSLIQFQKGILLSNRSIVELFLYLQKRHSDVQYILTTRLNQDILENFFSYMRGMGSSDHPNPLDFIYRMRWFILGKHSASVFTENRNTEETGEQFLIQPPEQTSEHPEFEELNCITADMFGNISTGAECLENSREFQDEENLIPYSFINPCYEKCHTDGPDMSQEVLELLGLKEKINNDSLTYIAGYVAHKFRKKYNLGTEFLPVSSKDLDGLQFISRGGLLRPNNSFLQAAQIMDTEFQKMHGNTLSREKGIFKTLTQRTIEKIENPIPYDALHCLCRTRTYIRLREINKQISFHNLKNRMEKN